MGAGQNHEEAAQKIQGSAPEHASDIKKGALNEYGKALHAVTDGTSPEHTDANGDPKIWPGFPPENNTEAEQELAHKQGEATATPEEFEDAVVDAQQSFKTTFGDAAFQDATTIPNESVEQLRKREVSIGPQ